MTSPITTMTDGAWLRGKDSSGSSDLDWRRQELREHVCLLRETRRPTGSLQSGRSGRDGGRPEAKKTTMERCNGGAPCRFVPGECKASFGKLLDMEVGHEEAIGHGR